MNLKELTEVKEFLDVIIDKCCFIDEQLAMELDAGPDGAGEPLGQEADSDTPPDPLEEARVAVQEVVDLVGAVLDHTEVYRKRYLGQRQQSGGGVAATRERDEVESRTRGSALLTRRRQLELPTEGGSSNGTRKKSRTAIRPLK